MIIQCIFYATGSEQPVSAYDKNNVKVVFHIGKDRPRPDVMVMVVSTMSTNTSPVKKFQFQAAVPKVRLSFFIIFASCFELV